LTSAIAAVQAALTAAQGRQLTRQVQCTSYLNTAKEVDHSADAVLASSNGSGLSNLQQLVVRLQGASVSDCSNDQLSELRTTIGSYVDKIRQIDTRILEV